MKRAVTLAMMIALLGAGSLAATDAPASASSKNPVAIWQMNEAKGAKVMIDTSGHHLNGTIGDQITTGYASQGVVGYKFPYINNSSPTTRGT